MFVRPNWRPRTIEEHYRVIDENPWALLINNADDGPGVTNLPLLLDRSRGLHGTLIGHIARANDHSRILQSAQAPTLAVFQGPYSYVTASWYPERHMPPTYYYTSVHCYGRVRLQTDAELERWLVKLTETMESRFQDGWSVNEMDSTGMSRRIPHILGFELEIERIEGKFKLGQDEPKKDAMAVQTRLAVIDDPSHRALAKMVNDYNAGRPDVDS